MEHQERENEDLLIRETRHQTFWLSGKILSKVAEVAYIGVPWSASGVRDIKMFER